MSINLACFLNEKDPSEKTNYGNLTIATWGVVNGGEYMLVYK